MTKSRQIIYGVLVLFLGTLVTMGSYAFFTWSSSVNKQVSFNTAKELLTNKEFTQQSVLRKLRKQLMLIYLQQSTWMLEQLVLT